MTYKIAQTYAQLGDKQSALRLLRRSIELNFYPYAYFASDPLMEPLRGEPELFQLSWNWHDSASKPFANSCIKKK